MDYQPFIRETIRRKFIQFCILENLPLQVTSPTHPLPLLNGLAVQILPDLKEVIRYRDTFFRYDLTLGLYGRRVSRRAQIGLVYRHGPSGRYRWRVFQQADIDLAYSASNQQQFCRMYQRLWATLLPQACEIRYNNLAILRNLLPGLTRKQLRTLDEGGNLDPAVADALRAQPAKSRPWVLTPTLVRGLHMYRGLVFQVYGRVPHALGGGGHYALGAVEYVGGSVGVYRLARYIVEHKLYVRVLYKPGCLDLFKTAIERVFLYPVYGLRRQNWRTVFLKSLQADTAPLILLGQRQVADRVIVYQDLVGRTKHKYRLVEGNLRYETSTVL